MNEASDILTVSDAVMPSAAAIRSTDLFHVIYCDPPWKYSFPGTRAEKTDDYPTMNTWEISRLRVEKLAAKDCTIFMWGIWTKLVDAVRVMEAWGFEYKTVGFVWVKANPSEQVNQLTMIPQPTIKDFMGMGMWTRSNTEYCLIGVRGNPKRQSASVKQVVYAPVREHSEKPPEVRDRIVELMGDVPRIELFARQRAEGWSAWGNELTSDVEL